MIKYWVAIVLESSMRKREMAEAAGMINHRFEFHCPQWFADVNGRVKRFPGEVCLHHKICIEVERDMRRLHRQFQSRTQTEEEVEKEEEEMRLKYAIDLYIRDMTLEKKEAAEEEKKMMIEHKRKRGEGSIEEGSIVEGSIEEGLKQEEDCTLELAFVDTSSSFSRVFREKWTMKRSEPYMISDLFSNMKFLVNHHGEQVSIDQLKGKYLLLYFWPLPRLHEHALNKPDPEFNAYMEEVYNLQRENFEIVFVALGNNEDAFSETFSRMPWLAIPHKDQQARDFFIDEFAIPNPTYERAVLFAPNGTVVRENAKPAFICYGAYGFPFTGERIDVLVSECDSLRSQIFVIKQMPSLTELLGEHLISREQEKVLTSELGLKTVGLYFFEPARQGIQRTSKLLETWNSLTAQQRDDFKIVIINKAPFNVSNAMAVFRKKFEHAAPCWYSLEVCGLKLCRVFRKECRTETDKAGDLIVLKPDKYQVLSYFAFNILVQYGSDAYPFTLERAVKLTKRRQQNELVWDKLLSPENPLCREGCAQYKVDIVDTTVKKLRGKCDLLLFATHSCCESGSFLRDLKQLYEKKGTYDDFEIIYISLDCDKSPSAFPKSTQGMPWLVHSFVPHFAVDLARRLFDVFPPHLPAIAAFGADGHLETKESNFAFKSAFKSEYPFIQADMDEEVHGELIFKYNWNLKRLVDSFF